MRKVSVYGEVEVPDEVAEALFSGQDVHKSSVQMTVFIPNSAYRYSLDVPIRWHEVGHES